MEHKAEFPEATGDLGWKVHMVQSRAGAPAWFPSIIATVPQIPAEGRSPAERLLPLAQRHKNAAILLLDTGLPPAAPRLSHIRCPSGDEKMQTEPHRLS